MRTRMFIAALFVIAQIWKEFKCPKGVVEWIMVHPKKCGKKCCSGNGKLKLNMKLKTTSG